MSPATKSPIAMPRSLTPPHSPVKIDLSVGAAAPHPGRSE